MNVRKFIGTVLFLLVGLIVTQEISAQEVSQSPLGFAMEKPKGWISTTDEKKAESLKNLELSDEALDAVLRSRNNSVEVLTFQKYRAEDREGPIPTIQVRMRTNPIPDFDTFMAAFLRSIDPSRSPLTNYKIVEQGTAMIGDNKAVKVTTTYAIGTDKLAVLTYVIPVGKQYFQVTFIDTPPAENNAALFDSLAKTIRIDRSQKKSQ